MKDQARNLIARGFTTPQIARKLGVCVDTALKYVRTPTDSYEPTDTPSEAWKGARARAAKLLLSLGLTQKRAAKFMQVTRRTVYNYLRYTEATGNPLIRVALTKKIVGRQNELIERGEYRLLDFAPDVGMVRLDKKDGCMVHFVCPTALRDNFYLISDNLFEEYPCNEN